MPTKHGRDVAAVAIALLAFGLGLLPLTVFHYEPGIHLGVDRAASRLQVIAVDPWAPAAQDGVDVGMIVLSMNGTPLIDLPQQIFAPESPASADPTGDPDAEPTPPAVVGIQPAVPTPRLDPEALGVLATQPIDSLELIRSADLIGGSAGTGYATFGVYYPGWNRLYDSGLAILPGLAILLIGSWWL